MIAILGAMSEEIAALRAALIRPEAGAHAGLSYWFGELAGCQVVLMQCGIGKVNAALGCALLAERFRLDALINTGSAGGLAEDLNPGDVVIAEALSYCDVDVTAFGYALGQMAGMPEFYSTDPFLSAEAARVAEVPEHAQVRRGLIVSGDRFVAGGPVRAAIRKDFPKALAVDMESTAIAQSCYRYGIPFAIVRAISDRASGAADEDFASFLPKAAAHSAATVRALCAKIAPKFN